MHLHHVLVSLRYHVPCGDGTCANHCGCTTILLPRVETVTADHPSHQVCPDHHNDNNLLYCTRVSRDSVPTSTV